MKKKGIVLGILLLGILLLPVEMEDVWNQSLGKISTMFTLIQDNYFQETNDQEMTYSAIRGMLHTLDPHSNFLDPESLMRMREEQVGKYSGLGIQILKQDDRLLVISPIEGTPAYRLGIQAGDVISHINGESTKPISAQEAVSKLRGKRGTKVQITIVREGLEKPLQLTVIREEIPFYSVPYSYILQDGVGYIFIRHFAETTVDEFEEKMKLLLNQGMRNLILDLRGNTGGPLFQSIELSDEFLPKGALIVSIKGRNQNYNREFRAVRANQYETIPLVILINQGSASASEIVSGAVMDNDRGLIIGEDSWGKGLVQTVFPLGPDMAVAISTAKYYTPSGRSIQRDYSQLDDYLMNKETPEDEREVRYTSKGRKVLGQGGITPDITVPFSFKPLTMELLGRMAFFSYARKLANHNTPLSRELVFPWEEKADDKKLEKKRVVGRDLVVDSVFIQDFKDYLKDSKIEYSSERFAEAETEIQRELEREIFSAIWGQEEGIKAYRKSDPVVLKAIQSLSEASKLLENTDTRRAP